MGVTQYRRDIVDARLHRLRSLAPSSDHARQELDHQLHEPLRAAGQSGRGRFGGYARAEEGRACGGCAVCPRSGVAGFRDECVGDDLRSESCGFGGWGGESGGAFVRGAGCGRECWLVKELG